MNLEHYFHKGRELVDGRITTVEHWFKYGYVEYVDDEIIQGQINLKYRGRTHEISMIRGELFIAYISTQLKGSKHFTTTKNFKIQGFWKDFDNDDLKKIVTIRTDVERINNFMDVCERIYERWLYDKKIQKETSGN